MNYSVNIKDSYMYQIADMLDEIDAICNRANNPNALGEIEYCPQEACKHMQEDISAILKLSDEIYKVFKKIIEENS